MTLDLNVNKGRDNEVKEGRDFNEVYKNLTFANFI